MRKWLTSFKNALGFEVIHLPVDFLILWAVGGSATVAVGALLVQHGIVVALHTMYDRYIYRKSL